MKDRVGVDHLTKFNAFRLNGDQVMDFKTWFKILTNVLKFDTASPKTIQTVNIFIDNFCHNCKNFPVKDWYYLKEAEIKMTAVCLPILVSWKL